MSLIADRSRGSTITIKVDEDGKIISIKHGKGESKSDSDRSWDSTNADGSKGGY